MLWPDLFVTGGICTDYATDSIIQRSLRSELKSDVTLMTIAHRLQTIMDSDKIVSHCCLAALGRADVFRFRADGARCRTYRESIKWKLFLWRSG